MTDPDQPPSVDKITQQEKPPLTVEQAVALVAAHDDDAVSVAEQRPPAVQTSQTAGKAIAAQLVVASVTVVGQIVTRKKVSKRLLILNLRQACGAQRGNDVPAQSTPVFVTVIVKEHSVGSRTMDWVRHGSQQLRLGDYLQCTGTLEKDPKIGGAHAVLVLQGGGSLDVLERFEEQHPGCHWQAHLFDVPSVSRRLGRMAGSDAAVESDIFDRTSLQGVITAAQEGAVVPKATGSAAVEKYCKHWISTSRCNRQGCPFLHPTKDELPAARKAFHSARKRKGLRRTLEGDTIAPSEKRSKRERAAVFVDWLLKEFGEEYLRSGTGVVDVAGGRGDISFELCQRRGIPCSVIDPRLPGCAKYNNAQRRFIALAEKEGRVLKKPGLFATLLTPGLWEAAAMQDTGARVAGDVAAPSAAAVTAATSDGKAIFDEVIGQSGHGAPDIGPGNSDQATSKADSILSAAEPAAVAVATQAAQRHGNYHGTPFELPPSERCRLVETLRGASVIVGMHPDQATEHIVSCALALGKPWAVVPCCVFARENPNRRLYENGFSPLTDVLSSKSLCDGSGADGKMRLGSGRGPRAPGPSKLVVEFPDFVEYLRRKPTECGQHRASQIYLPWHGKNSVVYSRPQNLEKNQY